MPAKAPTTRPARAASFTLPPDLIVRQPANPLRSSNIRIRTSSPGKYELLLPQPEGRSRPVPTVRAYVPPNARMPRTTPRASQGGGLRAPGPIWFDDSPRFGRPGLNRLVSG